MPSVLELAGLGEDGGAAAVDVIAEAEGAVVAVGEDGGEELFALAELEVAGVVAVEVEEVEDEVGERVALAFVEGGLQVAKEEMPRSSRTTTSPSSVSLSAGRAATASATARMRWVQSRPLRVRSWTREPDLRAWMR